MQREKPRAILTDLDGTLIQSADAICSALQDSFLHIGQKPPDKQSIMDMFGLPVEVMLTGLTPVEPTDHQIIDEFIAEYKRQYIVHMETARLIPGAAETMHALAGRYPICLITSERRQNAAHILKRLGLDRDILYMVTRDDVVNFKPHPEPLLRAARLLGVMPSQCIYIGESPFDVQAGVKAGVYTIGVPSGHWSRESLEACKPERMIEDIAELLEAAGMA